MNVVPKIDFNQAAADGVLALFARETGKDAGDVVREQSALFVRDLLSITPPFRKFGAKESPAAQKRIGEKAVAGDILKAFRPIESHALFEARDERVGLNFLTALTDGNWETLRIITERTGTKPIEPQQIVASVSEADHQAVRDSRGRVRVSAKNNPKWVKNKRSVDRLVRTKKKGVGRAKGGWGGSASATRQPMPGWVSRHSAGVGLDRTRGQNPFFEARNPTAYLAAERRIPREALKRREGALMRQMKAKAEGRWKRLKGKP